MKRLWAGPFTRQLLVSHFASLARVSTGPWQGYKQRKKSFRILVGMYYHKNPSHSNPSEWVPQGHRGRQNRQHTKNGWKVHKLRSSHSAPYKLHGVGNRKHFLGSISKKTKRFMIFRPPSQNLQKVGFKWGGLEGSGPKTHCGMRLLDEIMILQRVKQFNSLGWGTRRGPKRPKMGGYVVFSPIYACLALI